MASQNFDRCLALTLRFEGGYSDHPADPGGATNMGITRATLAGARGRPVAKSEVMSLSRAEAAGIYRRLFWDRLGADHLPDGIDAAVFDYGVNSGCLRAVRALQRCLGEAEDGVIGPGTLAALAGQHPAAVISALCRARRGFLERLRTFQIFGRGWSARVVAIETAALAMAGAALAAAGKK